jgi:hypothetical protein
MDFTATDVPPAQAALVSRMVASELARNDALEVLSTDDLRRGVALEVEREQVGCDEESCIPEIADALGARLVVFGDVGALHDDVVVTLTLFDGPTASTRHKLSRVTSADALVHASRGAARELAGALVPTVSPWPFVAGGALATGALAGLAGGSALALALAVRGQASSSGADKALAGSALLPAGVVTAAGAGVALAGAGALAWLTFAPE